MSGYGATAEWYFEQGWTPLPLPHGAKTPPPKGTTGDAGREVSYADVHDWSESHGDGNIALRMPPTVVGLDIDGYKPNAIETINDHIARLGGLPPTWRSSARPDPVSGIYFYRVPEGVAENLRDPKHPQHGSTGSDVEIIRWDHRYAVVAPSLHPNGSTYEWYAPDGSCRSGAGSAPTVLELPPLPQSWIDELTVARQLSAPVGLVDMSFASGYEGKIIQGNIDRLHAMRAAATANPADYRGEPWDQTTFDVAARLTEVANAEWSSLTHEQVEALLLEHAPRDSGFGAGTIRAKLTSARTRVGSTAATGPTGGVRVDDSGLFRGANTNAPASTASSQRTIVQGNTVDVSLSAKAHEWARETVGTGALAGMFSRKGALVFTPKIGETGYIEPRDARAEGSASITRLDGRGLQARIQSRVKVVRLVEKPPKSGTFVEQREIFPLDVATMLAAAPDDATGLRELHGVVHAPTFRADGSLITTPGYDDATGLLFLPTGGQPPAIPDRPTMDDLRIAHGWLAHMLTDFRFVADEDRANYLGLLLTPLLRTLTPGPYKLGVIEAHQPGSGKTFLARAITSIHGGVMHAELPDDEPELAKVVASVLDAQTAPVIVFDNVTGLIRSPTLAGLLTSPTFQARRLGGNSLIEAENDRLWIITANNAALGGDLARRNIRVRIDPGMPHPEQRTHFVIADFESWVRENRGMLLWSLIVLVQHWVACGTPIVMAPRKDSYGTWGSVVQSILTTAGMPGIFDDISMQTETNDPETEEWEGFLQAIWSHLGDRPWTAKSLLGLVAHSAAQVHDPARPIPFDALPAGLYSGKPTVEPSTLAKSLGRWLTNREGRWAGQLTVRSGPKDRTNSKTWTIRQYGS